MSLLDLASLVLAPTATKEGKVYSAIPDTGEGDMTFTRGSAATRVNSAGLIEKERGNLLLQSNTFDTTWSVIRSSVTSGASDPFGGSNAWSFLTDTTADDQHYIYQVISQSGVGTLSIYAKANGYNWLRLRLPSEEAFFDLANGVTGSSTTGISASITDVGSGWYRCEVAISDMSSNPNVFIHIAEGDGDVVINGTPSGTDGLYIYAAQLEQGLVATDYIPTTTSAVYEGITDDLPRVDYSGGGCPSLLLEPQRSNLITQSEYFGTGWSLLSGGSFSFNQTTSPEGLQNASLLSGDGVNANAAYFSTSVTSGSSYSFSLFAKANGQNLLRMRGFSPAAGGNVIFDLSDGTIDTAPTDDFSNAKIEAIGNDGWYRCSVVATADATNSNALFGFDYSDSSASGGLFYIYGAMLEAGSYVSSYIPTYGVSSTRVADSCSLSNASNLIGQSEGTLFAEFDISENVNTESYILRIDETSYNNTILIFRRTDKKLQAVLRSSATTIISIITTETISDINKVALAYTSGDFAFYINGVLIGTSTSTYSNVITYDDVRIGGFNSTTANMNGKISQAILFPTRLTNDQLAELTK